MGGIAIFVALLPLHFGSRSGNLVRVSVEKCLKHAIGMECSDLSTTQPGGRCSFSSASSRPRCLPQITWTGASNSAWETGANWDNGTGPLAGDAALLNAGSDVDYSESTALNYIRISFSPAAP